MTKYIYPSSKRHQISTIQVYDISLTMTSEE